jgi:hypothetical protein
LLKEDNINTKYRNIVILLTNGDFETKINNQTNFFTPSQKEMLSIMSSYKKEGAFPPHDMYLIKSKFLTPISVNSHIKNTSIFMVNIDAGNKTNWDLGDADVKSIFKIYWLDYFQRLGFKNTSQNVDDIFFDVCYQYKDYDDIVGKILNTK